VKLLKDLFKTYTACLIKITLSLLKNMPMISSMTGYGKATAEGCGKKILIEVRTLNSRQLDLSVRLPQQYREFEPEIRALASSMLERGKADITLTEEKNGDEGGYSVHAAAVRRHFTQLKDLAKELGVHDDSVILGSVLRMPDILSASGDSLCAELKDVVMSAVTEALNACCEFRRSEGQAMAADLSSRCSKILALLEDVSPLESGRRETIESRLMNGFAEFGAKENQDRDRFEQELIYYIEKMDFSEEKVRLRKHCDYFLATMKENSSGRKLGFISQEMGREINTLGSKAYDAGIQKIVVCMKDELEKLREMLLNVL
jgi:uncharacterized protein (TIGR00255 family)